MDTTYYVLILAICVILLNAKNHFTINTTKNFTLIQPYCYAFVFKLFKTYPLFKFTGKPKDDKCVVNE